MDVQDPKGRWFYVEFRLHTIHSGLSSLVGLGLQRSRHPRLWTAAWTSSRSVGGEPMPSSDMDDCIRWFGVPLESLELSTRAATCITYPRKAPSGASLILLDSKSGASLLLLDFLCRCFRRSPPDSPDWATYQWWQKQLCRNSSRVNAICASKSLSELNHHVFGLLVSVIWINVYVDHARALFFGCCVRPTCSPATVPF